MPAGTRILFRIEQSRRFFASLTAFDHASYSWPIPLFAEMTAMTNADADSDRDEHWMREAISAARLAQAAGEVPVGVCIVSGDCVLAVAGNRTRADRDPTAHAEVVALRQAAHKVDNFRLPDAVVYSTIEPCVMCAGALIQARVRRLVYGALDERAGAVDSHFQICDTDFLNHRIDVTSGVLETECRELMQQFFKSRRQKNKDEGGRMKAKRRS